MLALYIYWYGKNENWHICTVLKRVRSVLQHHSRSYIYLFFGKEQYMCWGGRTVVQSRIIHVPPGKGKCSVTILSFHYLLNTVHGLTVKLSPCSCSRSSLAGQITACLCGHSKCNLLLAQACPRMIQHLTSFRMHAGILGLAVVQPIKF